MTASSTRRGLLAGAAGADLVLPYARPMAASSASLPDAALLALREPCERTRGIMDVMSTPHDDAEEAIRNESGLAVAERDYRRAVDANSDVIAQAVNMRARTIDGLVFKARISERERHTNLDLVGSINADILAIGRT